MQCPNGCANGMKLLKVERIFHKGSTPVVIRELELVVCPRCGCEMMPLRSARIVENVLDGRVEPVGLFSAPLFEPSAVSERAHY